MKIVEKVVKINKALIKVGHIVEMEDILSCDKFRAVVTDVDDFNLKVLRLKDLQEIILSAEQLDNHEVKFMRLGYVGEYDTKIEAKKDNRNVSTKRDTEHIKDPRKDKTCEYNVFEDLVKQLNDNYLRTNRM